MGGVPQLPCAQHPPHRPVPWEGVPSLFGSTYPFGPYGILQLPKLGESIYFC